MDSSERQPSVQHSAVPRSTVQHVSPQSKHIPQPEIPRKPKTPSVRRACISCHSGKTKCSEVLPCQNCLKKGQGATCTYPDPDAPVPAVPAPSTSNNGEPSAPSYPGNTASSTYPAASPSQAVGQAQYYQDYNGVYTGASSSTFRPNKRARALTEDETAAITRNFKRGDFYVGNSAPVRIDPRLPLRLTLTDGDTVHFVVGEPFAS